MSAAIYEYKLIPAPQRAERIKGVKGNENRFIATLEGMINEAALEGWVYLRSDTLPQEERSGFGGRTKSTRFRTVMVFQRELRPEVVGCAAVGRAAVAEAQATVAPAEAVPAEAVAPEPQAEAESTENTENTESTESTAGAGRAARMPTRRAQITAPNPEDTDRLRAALRAANES